MKAHRLSWWRATSAIASGAIATVVAVVAGTGPSVAALCGSDAAALVFVGSILATVLPADPAEVARVAGTEGPSRPTGEAVLVWAAVASLVAVAFTLGEAGAAGPPTRGLLAAFSLLSVALAWGSVHTVFLLRYARLYYTRPEGGIDFHGDRPDYRDFAYLALTIAVTFAVSDTDLTERSVRRTATHHLLLSYVFGTGIVAVAVSSAAALLHS
jgi:uncharacterized membrane protein